jgi:ATP-dependent RNA helicase DeaD
MLPLKPPTNDEAFQGRVAIAEKEIEDLVSKTHEDQFSDQTKELLEKYTPEQLVAALLSSKTKADSSQVKVRITPERPLPKHKGGKGGNYHGNGHRGGGYRGNNKRRSNSSSSYRGNRDNNHGKSSDRSHGNYKKNSGSSNNSGNRHSSSNSKFTIREHN